MKNKAMIKENIKWSLQRDSFPRHTRPNIGIRASDEAEIICLFLKPCLGKQTSAWLLICPLYFRRFQTFKNRGVI